MGKMFSRSVNGMLIKNYNLKNKYSLLKTFYVQRIRNVRNREEP